MGKAEQTDNLCLKLFLSLHECCSFGCRRTYFNTMAKLIFYVYANQTQCAEELVMSRYARVKKQGIMGFKPFSSL